MKDLYQTKTRRKTKAQVCTAPIKDLDESLSLFSQQPSPPFPMAFRHRKLLNESAAGLDSLCEGDCDAYRNPDEVCSFKCIDYCPSICKFPIFQTPPPTAAIIRSSPTLKSHRLSILLTATLAAAFFLLTCYTIYRLYYNSRGSRRRRQQEGETGTDDLLEEDLGPAVDHPIWYIRTIGLQPSVIGAITIVRYNKGEGLVDGTDCSVCLNEFQHDETLRLLPKCNHAFHLPCIDTWLRSHTNCPLCRAGIVSNTASLPTQAQISQIPAPDPVEEPLHELSGRIIRREVDMVGVETESSDSMIGVVSGDDTVSGAQNEPKVNEEGLRDGIKPTRRTISMNSLSAMANAFPNRNIDNNLVESKVSTCGVVGFNRSSTERPIQAGPSSVKRSLSCGETVFVSSHASMNKT